MATCRQCGTTFRPGTRFCTGCGAACPPDAPPPAPDPRAPDVPPPPASTQPESPSPTGGSGRWVLGCLAALACTCLLVCGGVLGVGYWGCNKAKTWVEATSEQTENILGEGQVGQLHAQARSAAAPFDPRNPGEITEARLEKFARIRRELRPLMDRYMNTIAQVWGQKAQQKKDLPIEEMMKLPGIWSELKVEHAKLLVKEGVAPEEDEFIGVRVKGVLLTAGAVEGADKEECDAALSLLPGWNLSDAEISRIKARSGAFDLKGGWMVEEMLLSSDLETFGPRALGLDPAALQDSGSRSTLPGSEGGRERDAAGKRDSDGGSTGAADSAEARSPGAKRTGSSDRGNSALRSTALDAEAGQLPEGLANRTLAGKVVALLPAPEELGSGWEESKLRETAAEIAKIVPALGEELSGLGDMLEGLAGKSPGGGDPIADSMKGMADDLKQTGSEMAREKPGELPRDFLEGLRQQRQQVLQATDEELKETRSLLRALSITAKIADSDAPPSKAAQLAEIDALLAGVLDEAHRDYQRSSGGYVVARGDPEGQGELASIAILVVSDAYFESHRARIDITEEQLRRAIDREREQARQTSPAMEEQVRNWEERLAQLTAAGQTDSDEYKILSGLLEDEIRQDDCGFKMLSLGDSGLMVWHIGKMARQSELQIEASVRCGTAILGISRMSEGTIPVQEMIAQTEEWIRRVAERLEPYRR